MARFLLRMVNFIAIATFWKYMDFAWFTREEKNFLQVQREQCQRLCNDIKSLEKCLKIMKASSKKIVFNRNQCVNLLGKLILAMKRIHQMLSSAIEDLKFQPIFEELCYLQKKIEIVLKNCTNQEQWCHSAVFQLQNKETFRELVLNLKHCYNTARDVYLFYHPNQSYDMFFISFDAATYKEVLEDGEDLKEKLEIILQGEISEDYEIAQHLLLRLRNLDRVDGGDLDALEVPNHFKTLKLIQRLGSYGEVYKSNWLGLTCATKVLKVEHDNLMNSRKEAGILAGLSHPNLVQFFGCGINKKIGENSMKDEIGEIYLVMELMDSNLSTMLKKEKRPLSYPVAIDIIHQIAKGVHYLHDMQVAHLDLKPDKVLCSSICVEDLDPSCTFKVTDYGTSQLEVCSNPKHPEPTKYTIRTRGYMAPKMTKGSRTPRYPFQADVWSFAMICSEILSRKVSYFDLEPKAFYNQVKCTYDPSLHLNLPNNCEGLATLIRECWSEDPLQRPTFFEICDRLTNLKKCFGRGGYCKLRDSESIKIHVPRVDEPIARPKEILVDLDHQLSKVKGLLKMNYIGIVGMGGIGKTTLAKAILDDTTMKSSYQASCFVGECKNYQNSYEILCKILSKLGNDQEPKNLGDAQEMMKELLVEKKVLLILDDVNRGALVHDIVPPDIVQVCKGITIIITTRQWSTIKSFVGIEGRLDVELLDKTAATSLFTSHLGWDVASLSPDFAALCKLVVKACNGLPLSLKVMGAFLRNKTRLRSWERALQRMARGRNLDGDDAIWNTLQISFDGLNDGVEKNMFLDLACFFCQDVYPFGISKTTILSIWIKDGILPICELERLIDMSLLKVNGNGDILKMHDQLRDMGRMIAKDTRIWKASMTPEGGFSSKDVEVLQGISFQGAMNHHIPLLKQDQIFDFEKLCVLILVGSFSNPEAHIASIHMLLEIALQCSQLKAIIVRNFEDLIYFPRTLSSNTKATFLNTISNICCTQYQIFVAHNIKSLVMHICNKFFKQLPNQFMSSNTLLRLSLSFCINLEALPKEVENLSSLTTLNLSHCSSLLALPIEVGNLSSLSTFNLSWCSSLVALPKEVGNLSALTTLNLSQCSSLVDLPKEVGNLSALTTLNLSQCSSLVDLPKEVGNLSALTTLYLIGCSRLAALPMEVGNLSCLTIFNLSGCSSLVALPMELGNLSSLMTFNLGQCSSLVVLPKEVGNLSYLTTLNLSWCLSLVALPKEVGNLSCLTTLNLIGCSSLVALPMEVGNLSFITTLNLMECSSLVDLPKEVGNLSRLTTLNLTGCSSIVTLPKELKNLFCLTSLYLNDCSSLIPLLKESENLSCLTTLGLIGCSNLVSLAKEIESLSCLTTLKLSWCSSLIALPKGSEELVLLDDSEFE